MIESISINHHIQKHIIESLMYVRFARFRDLRPAGVDTNVYTYHLNAVVKAGLVQKTEAGYSLSSVGLSYVDRVSTTTKSVRTQPKIISMLVIQNSQGDILLQKRTKQPYIDAWTLPYGKVHVDDMTTVAAAQREAYEKLGLSDQSMTQAGDCYIRVLSDGALLSTTLAHVFRFTSDIEAGEDCQWVQPSKVSDYRLAPAVQEVMTRSFSGDQFFFEDFTVEWNEA